MLYICCIYEYQLPCFRVWNNCCVGENLKLSKDTRPEKAGVERKIKVLEKYVVTVPYLLRELAFSTRTSIIIDVRWDSFLSLLRESCTTHFLSQFTDVYSLCCILYTAKRHFQTSVLFFLRYMIKYKHYSVLILELSSEWCWLWTPEGDSPVSTIERYRDPA